MFLHKPNGINKISIYAINVFFRCTFKLIGLYISEVLWLFFFENVVDTRQLECNIGFHLSRRVWCYCWRMWSCWNQINQSFCRFSISVLGMSNKFSIEVSTKNVVDVVESLICFVELEIWNMIISFHGIVSH